MERRVKEGRKITKIIVHCSASDTPYQDDIEAVRELHTSAKNRKINWGKYPTHGKGWSQVGYHYFIKKNGLVQKGRDSQKKGAHTLGENPDSIGVCVSGDTDFTVMQMRKLIMLLQDLMAAHGLTKDDIYPHNHFSKYKTCPNFDLQKILEEL